MAGINLLCPQCGQIDSVRKVSSIVGDGIATSTFSSYGVGVGYSSRGITLTDNYKTYTGSSKTGLSQLLSPPAKLTEHHFDWILLLMALPGTLGILATCLGIGDLFYNPGTAAKVLFFGILFLCGAVLLFLYYRDKVKEERAKFEDDLQEWKAAVSKWQKLYYCNRCDGVFVPNQNHIIPSQHAYDYLYVDTVV